MSSPRPAAPGILIDHLGYGLHGPRTAIATTEPSAARLINADTGDHVQLVVHPPQRVAGWSFEPWSVIDIEPATGAGNYWIEIDVDGETIASERFAIGEHRLQQLTVSDVLYYFKAVRSSGEIDRKDASAFRYGSDSTPVDARGGWLDASGDQSKFLSHLTYTRFMSPQQIPLCAWAMMAADERLAARHSDLHRAVHARMRDESLFGADFLVRFQDPAGYFYTAIFDALTKQLDERLITAPLQDCVRTDRYQAAYRHGGGLAIAALARASTLDDHGEFAPARYLDAAIRGLEHLEEHNREYSFDGTESIIDDYCALLAASEIENATGRNGTWRATAQARASALIERYDHDRGYAKADIDDRPYAHAVEMGLPILALLRYADVFGDQAHSQAIPLAIQWMSDIIARTDSVPNPFGYPRHVAKPNGADMRESFFFPHDNDTGYWWQGENANIASLSAAASALAEHPACPPDLATRLNEFADDQIHWILGRNPFDACMLQGRGRNNVEYSSTFQNVPGGILNGITAGMSDENDIDFVPAGPVADGNGWRWAEQWIPHAGWFLLAVSSAR